jgi:hypothetical protein
MDMRSDAVCTQTPHGWVRSHPGLTIDGDQLRGWSVQWAPTHDNGSGCDPSTHTYRLVLYQLLPSTVRLALSEGSLSDNRGAITVRFERVA